MFEPAPVATKVYVGAPRDSARAPLSSARLFLARLGSALAWLPSDQLGSAGPGPALLGSARAGSAQLGLSQLGLASPQLGSPGSAQPGLAPFGLARVASPWLPNESLMDFGGPSFGLWCVPPRYPTPVPAG